MLITSPTVFPAEPQFSTNTKTLIINIKQVLIHNDFSTFLMYMDYESIRNTHIQPGTSAQESKKIKPDYGISSSESSSSSSESWNAGFALPSPPGPPDKFFNISSIFPKSPIPPISSSSPSSSSSFHLLKSTFSQASLPLSVVNFGQKPEDSSCFGTVNSMHRVIFLLTTFSVDKI
uniref:CSON015151 protein n=1 Tax=Culicoides sonorensis TaxID=179676 RepID=A0A336MCH3_CULSO